MTNLPSQSSNPPSAKFSSLSCRRFLPQQRCLSPRRLNHNTVSGLSRRRSTVRSTDSSQLPSLLSVQISLSNSVFSSSFSCRLPNSSRQRERERERIYRPWKIPPPPETCVGATAAEVSSTSSTSTRSSSATRSSAAGRGSSTSFLSSSSERPQMNGSRIDLGR